MELHTIGVAAAEAQITHLLQVMVALAAVAGVLHMLVILLELVVPD